VIAFRYTDEAGHPRELEAEAFLFAGEWLYKLEGEKRNKVASWFGASWRLHPDRLIVGLHFTGLESSLIVKMGERELARPRELDVEDDLLATDKDYLAELHGDTCRIMCEMTRGEIVIADRDYFLPRTTLRPEVRTRVSALA
jgi:hypothetical protein